MDRRRRGSPGSGAGGSARAGSSFSNINFMLRIPSLRFEPPVPYLQRYFLPSVLLSERTRISCGSGGPQFLLLLRAFKIGPLFVVSLSVTNSWKIL